MWIRCRQQTVLGSVTGSAAEREAEIDHETMVNSPIQFFRAALTVRHSQGGIEDHERQVVNNTDLDVFFNN